MKQTGNELKTGLSIEEKAARLALAVFLLICGILSLNAPAFLYELILNLVIFYLFLYGIFHFIRYFTSGRTRHRDLMSSTACLIFGVVLLFYQTLPEWMIRVAFGFYCFACSLIIAIQVGINLHNRIKTHIQSYCFMAAYLVIAFLVLFTPRVSTLLLLRAFGVYFILLGIRYLIDCLDTGSSRYKWKRGLHISMPTVLAAVMPDYTLSRINEAFNHGREYLPAEAWKKEEPVILRAMVHIGPEGFQKVGHFTFSWKGVVYSYGNYDTESGRFFGMLGDGVFFKVPFENYIPNIVKYERNTIFEYGIRVTKEQEQAIEEKLKKLEENSYRWYCQLERTVSHSLGQLESDYPSRLHYRTGAKFYKIKSGSYKTYWAGGDNCVLFGDEFLGIVGADVLSIRGIITPGAYFDYLQSEYVKEGSPIVECKIHPYREVEGGI